MARPRKNAPPDEFTMPEIAAAIGVIPRNAALLVEHGLLPSAEQNRGSGQAGNKSFGSYALQRAAIIGALHVRAGTELFLAAKLAAVIADEFESAYVDMMANLSRYLEPPLNPRCGHFPWEHVEGDPRPDNNFWLHHFLTTRTALYQARTTLPSDFMIELVDREFVLSGFYRPPPSDKPDPGTPLDPMFRVLEWERGASAQIQTAAEEAGNSSHPEWKARGQAVWTTYAAARRNAVGIIRLNLSLSVRNALDAIQAHRGAAGAKYDWRSRPPPPDRYAGCDLQGLPLDPNHPWNVQLPPERREVRLCEIEEYVAERDRLEIGGHQVDSS